MKKCFIENIKNTRILTVMRRNPFSEEYQSQWLEVYKRRGEMKGNYVPLIEYWLDGIGLKAKKTTIRHVLNDATYNWTILILLGKLVNYQVKLPKEFEVSPEIKSVLLFQSQPKIT